MLELEDVGRAQESESAYLRRDCQASSAIRCATALTLITDFDLYQPESLACILISEWAFSSSGFRCSILLGSGGQLSQIALLLNGY